MSKKIQAYIPISSYPCFIAQDRRELTPEAFERRHGSNVPICNCVDHNAPKFKNENNSTEIDRLTNDQSAYLSSPDEQYQQDLSNEMPRAEALVYNGISNLIPSCANHANSMFKHFLLGMERHLQLLRPTLNPGEGNNTQRRFQQRAQRRKDAHTKFLQDVAKRPDNGKIGDESFDPDWGSEGLNIFEGNDRPLPLDNEIGSIMKNYMGWDKDGVEE